MLPLNANQLSYQDVGNTVWRHKSRIENFCKDNSIKFDLVVSKLRNGIHAGSIISTYLHLPFGVIEVDPSTGNTRTLWPLDVDRNKELNILLVDTVSNTGASLTDMQNGILKEQPNAKVYTYATFVAAENTFKPSIPGEVIKKYIQPAWEWLSFTPSSHLDRLENGNDNIFSGRDYFVAISSKEAFETLQTLNESLIDENKISIYQNFAANKNIGRSHSGLSSIDLNQYRGKGIDAYSGALKRVITDKIDFITKNGVTHFIEENLEEAVVLAQNCPVTHILYIEKTHLIRISAYDYFVKNLRVDK